MSIALFGYICAFHEPSLSYLFIVLFLPFSFFFFLNFQSLKNDSSIDSLVFIASVPPLGFAGIFWKNFVKCSSYIIIDMCVVFLVLFLFSELIFVLNLCLQPTWSTLARLRSESLPPVLLLKFLLSLPISVYPTTCMSWLKFVFSLFSLASLTFCYYCQI